MFYAQVPSPGRYHLYLDFKHRGVVRTAAFTVTGTATSEPVDAEEEPEDSDESEEPHSEGH